MASVLSFILHSFTLTQSVLLCVCSSDLFTVTLKQSTVSSCFLRLAETLSVLLPNKKTEGEGEHCFLEMDLHTQFISNHSPNSLVMHIDTVGNL